MPYFSDNENHVNFKSFCRELEMLRECQRGALMAVTSHFTASDSPAVVSMPTGSGKTELMACLGFILDASRVLVVEPSTFLRKQTASRIKNLQVLKANEVIQEEAPEPEVFNLKRQCRTDLDWSNLERWDVVVATPKTISPEEEGVCVPPDQGLFDLVIIDEAHHLPAKTWRSIMKVAFPSAKFVLLTATPFRRDRRRLPGKLVYHYSISKAMDAGIYRPVEFSPVDYQADERACDLALARRAAQILNAEAEQINNAKIIVRVDKDDEVIIADDLLATGGTMSAVVKLVEELGAEIVECAFMAELGFLGGRKKLPEGKVFSLLKF